MKNKAHQAGWEASLQVSNWPKESETKQGEAT